MSQGNNGEFVEEVDDEVMAQTEPGMNELTELVGHMANDQKSSGEELSLYENWMPGAEKHQGKTNIKEHQAHALAGVRQLALAFKMLGINIPGLNAMLTELVVDYEQYRTSIDGMSREEQVRVLMAKAGVHADMEDAGRSLFRQAVSGKGDDDE